MQFRDGPKILTHDRITGVALPAGDTDTGRFTAGDRRGHSVTLNEGEVFVSVVHEPTALARGWHTV